MGEEVDDARSHTHPLTHKHTHCLAHGQADKKVGEEGLHRWLTLARLLAMSHGEATVSNQRWQEMLALEARRLARV